jgi:hypothetical protein
MMDFEHTIAATAGPDGALPAAQEPAEMERGATVGRFVLLGTLGAGGMGVVYAAYDPELDRKVALKLLLPHADGSAGSGGSARLMREAQALAKLSHPNVVAVHDVGTDGDSVWIAMEFVAGQTLTAWAGARPRSWTEVLPLLADVARGVSAAHQAGGACAIRALAGNSGEGPGSGPPRSRHYFKQPRRPAPHHAAAPGRYSVARARPGHIHNL